MRKLHLSLALTLALGMALGCEAPPQDRTDPDRVDADRVDADEIGRDIQQTANSFVSDAREAVNELGDKFDDLETRNANLQGEGATAWARAREEIIQAREQLESDINNLGNTTEQEADEVHSRIARNLETVTHRVERAELLATNGNQEFVTAAQERLREIDTDVQSLQAEAARLPMEARESATNTVEGLRSDANDVRESVESIAQAGAQDIAERREQVAEDVAELSASVRREQFELQAELTN